MSNKKCIILQCISNYKKYTKQKLLAKMGQKLCTFFTFTHVPQIFLREAFCWCFFSNIFTEFEINTKLCVFVTFFEKKFFCHINTKKKKKLATDGPKKTYLINVSQMSILHTFSKNSQICFTLLHNAHSPGRYSKHDKNNYTTLILNVASLSRKLLLCTVEEDFQYLLQHQ